MTVPSSIRPGIQLPRSARSRRAKAASAKWYRGAVKGKPRRADRLRGLEPLELRALLSADLFETLLGGPQLLEARVEGELCSVTATALPADGVASASDSGSGVLRDAWSVETPLSECGPMSPDPLCVAGGGVELEGGDFDPSSIIVRIDGGADIERLLAGALPGAHVAGAITLVPGLHLIDLSGEFGVAEALATLGGLESVMYAEPNSYIYRQESFIPNDPHFSSLWGMHNTGQSGGTPGADISGPEAWSVYTGDSTVVVAVIDSGVDYNHPDLAGNIWVNPGEIPGDGIDNDGNGFIDDVQGWDFYNNDNNPMDDHSHGTHIAGTIAAIGNNGVGVAGVAWNAKIMPLKILGSDNKGTVWDAVKALNYAVANGAHVSNNSYADMSHSSFRDAIAAAGEAGHIFVAAAGNNGRNIDTDPIYPASYNLPNMIVVAGTTNTDGLASWSNYGVNSVHLGAPGVNIYSTMPAGSYGNKSGTSMATPHVVGTVALLRGLRPDWTVSQLKDAILSTADPVAALAGKTVSGGRLNAAAAVAAAYPTGPEIYVSLDGRNIAHGISNADFGFTIEGIPVARTFTVTNIGMDPQAAALQLNQSITLPTGFSLVSEFGATTLSAGESTTFAVRLDAAAPGTFSGTLSFVNNDSDENPFQFTVCGTAGEDTPVRIMDDGDLGFQTSASGWTYRSSSGYQADEYWTQNGSGSRTATWQFVVHPGEYRVAATWAAQTYWATNAPFSVTDGSNLLGTVRLNQTAAPNDFTDQGAAWETLGDFQISSNALVVTLSNDANNYVVADAIRIERVGDLPGGSPPVAGDDAIAVAEGATSTVLVSGATSLLDNDTDPDLPNDTLTVDTTPVTNVSHGTLTLYADGTFQYVHDGSETLSDSFVYRVRDAAGHTDTGTVTITVSPVNAAPVLTVPGAKTVNEDTLLAITGISVADVDAGTGAVKIIVSVANGVLTLAQATGLT
ncbi:MAG: choice-of-anchor D domain-containing protein, partial [Planctomycetes bacterium]|nr:choice-of-anchor D domain-containing protein [Planctomycetota bacterium]